MMQRVRRVIVDRARAAGVALAASLLFVTLVTAEPLAAASPVLPLLFDAPAAGGGPAPAAQQGGQRRETVRQRHVTARLGLLTHADGSPAVGVGQRIGLNLFDDASFSMTLTDVTRDANRGHTWSGTLDGIALG